MYKYILNEAKVYAKLDPKAFNMYYTTETDKGFWKLFRDPTPGLLTVYTNEEVVIAALLYYWMIKDKDRK